MPLLVKGNVWIIGACDDSCNSSNYGDCGDENCEGCIRDDSASVILHGMSQAKSLALAAYPETFIFRRDLKLCPTFNRLMTLYLNENWCVPDEHPLACILEHSPVLEQLILFMYCKRKEANLKMKGRFNPKELPPTISSHLKEVDIVCGGVDGNVLKVLKFLSKLSISATTIARCVIYIPFSNRSSIVLSCFHKNKKMVLFIMDPVFTEIRYKSLVKTYRTKIHALNGCF